MKLFLLFLFLTVFQSFNAQLFVRGVVSDESNSPIPYAKIFIKNSPEMRTVANVLGQYELSLMPGEYFLIINELNF